MKKVAVILLALLVYSQKCLGMMYAEPLEWVIDGPGGPYGVYAWRSWSTHVLLGPLQFESRLGFLHAKVVFFQIIPIVLSAILIGTPLLVLKRRSDQRGMGELHKRDLALSWSFYVLLAATLLAIGTVIGLPKYRARERERRDKGLSDALTHRDLALVKQHLSGRSINAELVFSMPQYEPPPLFLAVDGGTSNMEIVEYLIEGGADLSYEGLSGHYSVLHWADDPEMAKYLIDRGANIDARDQWGYTPLHGAALQGAADRVQVFLTHNADVNALDNADRSPLDCVTASQARLAEVKRLLLEYGAKTGNEVKSMADEESSNPELKATGKPAP